MHVTNIMTALVKTIDMLSENGIFNNKKIFIWGVSKASYISAQYLLKKGFDVISFLDNNFKLHGTVWSQLKNYAESDKELKIVSPDVLKDYSKNSMVLVFSRAYNDILTQALSYGIDKEHCVHMYSPEMYLNLDDFNELKEITIDERKVMQYNILKYLKEICEKHGIRYYLAAGTLLGAVRHKGYIPWDDDIDVYMPWEDYNRLIYIFKSGKENNGIYSLKYYGLADNFSWIYAKLQDNRTVSRGVRFPLICDIGINIDIFPMGGIPSDENKLKELKQVVADFQKKFAKHLVNFYDGIDTVEISKQIHSIMSMYKFDDSGYVGYFINGYWEWEKHSYAAYEKSVKLLFEDEYFNAPSGYDEVLTHSYGNYMEFPPDWQTKQYPHTYKAFWKMQYR